MSKTAPLERSELEQDVALMRRLHVREWKGIKLDDVPPPPAAPRPAAALVDQLRRTQEERHRVQFAASSFRPPMFEQQASTVVPRAVSARSGRRREHVQE